MSPFITNILRSVRYIIGLNIKKSFSYFMNDGIFEKATFIGLFSSSYILGILYLLSVPSRTI